MTPGTPRDYRAALVRRGVAPLRAGLLVGAGAFIAVDEGTSLSAMTDYHAESHLRGVVGHGTLGLVIGTLLSLVSGRVTTGCGRQWCDVR